MLKGLTWFNPGTSVASKSGFGGNFARGLNTGCRPSGDMHPSCPLASGFGVLLVSHSELCAGQPFLLCGLGGFAHLLSRVGMTLKFGADQNDCWEPVFGALHPKEAQLLKGHINEPRITKALVDGQCFHGVLCAGISCSGHSTMGDQLGMQDPRSLFLSLFCS